MKKKVIINLAIFFVILILIELASIVNFFFQILPALPSPAFLWQSSHHYDQVASTALINSIPAKFKHNVDPRLLPYSDTDIDNDHKYPGPEMFAFFHDPNYFIFKPNSSFNVIEKIKNTDLAVYNVQYEFNEYGNRKVENQKHKTKAKNFILAAGDSFTFGEGVTQGSDYPSQLASKVDDKWKIYNLGYLGDAPNDFVTRSKATHNLDQIKEEEGILIWLYISAQLYRVSGPLSAYRSESPMHYVLNKNEYLYEDGKFQYFGPFNENRRWQRKLWSFLSNSKTLEFIHFDYPIAYSESTLKLFFQLINEGLTFSNKKFHRKIIVRFDNIDGIGNFEAIAKDQGFDVINFFEVDPPQKNTGFYLYPDRHPSSQLYWMVTEILKNYVKNIPMQKSNEQANL